MVQRRGFMLIDIVIGVVVMSAAFGLMIALSASMVIHIARLRQARQIDAFAVAALERVIGGEGRPDVMEGASDLVVPEEWRRMPNPAEARIEATCEADGLVRVAVVVTTTPGKAPPREARFETIVPQARWDETRLPLEGPR